MKFSLVFCVLTIAIVGSAFGNRFPKRDCAPGTHYVLYCPRMLEATCTKPKRNHPEDTCDVPDCFCDKGTVRNRDNECVLPEDCHKPGDRVRDWFSDRILFDDEE